MNATFIVQGRRHRAPSSSNDAVKHLHSSCIRATVNGQVRAGDVTCFRTGDEGHHRGNIFNMPVAFQGRVGDLRRRPIGGGRI
jgi:hypothetical protein